MSGDEFLRPHAEPLPGGRGECQLPQQRVPVLLGRRAQDVRHVGQRHRLAGGGRHSGLPSGRRRGRRAVRPQLEPDRLALFVGVGPMAGRQLFDQGQPLPRTGVGRACVRYQAAARPVITHPHGDPAVEGPGRDLHLGARVHHRVGHQLADQKLSGVHDVRCEALQRVPHEPPGGRHALRLPGEPPGRCPRRVEVAHGLSLPHADPARGRLPAYPLVSALTWPGGRVTPTPPGMRRATRARGHARRRGRSERCAPGRPARRVGRRARRSRRARRALRPRPCERTP